MSESLQIRIHGEAALPTLIYLPGLHGDWLLVTRFRLTMAGRVRFVEFTYPHTVTWSVGDFAAAVAEQLRAHDIASGWVLAESFGSQVAWGLMESKAFRAEGLILAGGFVKHPWPGAVRVTEWLLRRLPLGLLTAVVNGYAVAARWRFKQDPEVLRALREFRVRWGEPLRQAAAHRTQLVASNDPRALAQGVRVPVFSLTGAWDPVVPWPPVQRWLRRECPGWRGSRVVWTADHNVLGTGTPAAAAQVLGWMAAERGRCA